MNGKRQTNEREKHAKRIGYTSARAQPKTTPKLNYTTTTHAA